LILGQRVAVAVGVAPELDLLGHASALPSPSPLCAPYPACHRWQRSPGS
jgi:hypothetical protein